VNRDNKHSILECGIHNNIDGIELPVSTSLVSFVKDYNKNRIFEGLPFQNQSSTFYKVVEAITSKQIPSLVIMGNAGVGKSLCIDFLIELLTKQRPVDEADNIYSGTAAMLKPLIDRYKEFEPSHLLFLPSLLRPYNNKSIPYKSEQGVMRDIEVIDAFKSNISGLLNSYIANNREHIREEISLDDFCTWIDSKVNEFYHDIFSDVSRCDRFIELQRKGGLLDVQLKTGKTMVPDKTFSQSLIDILYDSNVNYNTAGLRRAAGNPFSETDKRDIIKGLRLTYLNKILGRQYALMYDSIVGIDLCDGTDYLSKSERLKAAARIFNEGSAQLHKEILNGIQEERFSSHQDIADFIKSQKLMKYSTKKESSQQTRKYFLDSIQTIVKEYQSQVASPELQNWFDLFYRYFTENSHANIILKDMIRHIAEVEKNLEESAYYLMQEKDGKISAKKIQIERIRQYNNYRCMIKHGKYDMDIIKILKPKLFKVSTGHNCFTVATFRQITEDVKAKFSPISSEVAPYASIEDPGKILTSGGIIYVKDHFEQFLESLVKSGGGLDAEFLELFEKGQFTLVSDEGASFTIGSKHVLLGTANVNPFYIPINGTSDKEKHVGLESRIKLINASSSIPLNRDSIYGTIQVIYDEIDAFKKERPEAEHITISDEAVSLILSSKITDSGTRVSLEYRNLRDAHIRPIMNHALNQNISHITVDDIKQMKSKNFDFNEGDCVWTTLDNYNFSKDNIAPGLCYSIGSSGIVPIISKAIPFVSSGRGTGFEYLSAFAAKPELLELYETAKSYICSWLLKCSDDDVRKAWSGSSTSVKTSYKFGEYPDDANNYGTAIGVSILSALSEQSVKSSVIVNGFLDLDGDVHGTFSVYDYSRYAQLVAKKIGHPVAYLIPINEWKDFTNVIHSDIFNIRNNLQIIPVSNFSQVYYLATKEGEITFEDLNLLSTRAAEHMEDTLKRVYKNLQTWEQMKKDAMGF
jgi:hypothetical protein